MRVVQAEGLSTPMERLWPYPAAGSRLAAE
jgi:hypothetical protein